MTRKALITQFGPVEVTGQSFVANGIRYTAATLLRFTDLELATIGVHDIQEQTVPYGFRVIGAELGMVFDVVVEFLDLEEVPLEELRAEMFARLGELRWVHETGGITVGGVAVATDDRSQAKHLGVVSLFQLDPDAALVRWKVGPGHFETVLRDPGLTQALKVGRFVQACFAHEGDLTDAINAAQDAAALSLIDIKEGWPTTAA